MILRDGSCPGVVVWDRVHALHGSKELSTVWKRERHRGPESHVWDRLPVRLDLLWKIRSPWRKRKITNTPNLFIYLFWNALLNISILNFPEFESVGQEGAGLCSSDWLDVVLHGDSFLQEEVGGGPKDGGSESSEPAGLPRELLGRFQLVGNYCQIQTMTQSCVSF